MGSVTGAVTPAFMGMDAARAIETVADALRREVAPLGMAVSVVQSGFVRSPIIEKTDAKDRDAWNANQEMFTVYPKLRAKEYSEQMAPSGMAPMSVVADAVHHFFVSSTPKVRYVVGSVPSPVPTSALMVLLSMLPHHVVDLFE